jgi:hypothetical protein
MVRKFSLFYSIRISDSGEYECFYNKSNGYLFETGLETPSTTVAGKLIFSLLVHELIITFILDKTENLSTEKTPLSTTSANTTSPPTASQPTTSTPKSSQLKLFPCLCIELIQILVAIIAFIRS